MKTIIKQNTWLNFTSHGWGNGYVVIPEGHKLHGIDYNDIDVSVHGGLTFSALADSDMVDDWDELSEGDLGSWVVGFDTCHWGDSIDNWSAENVQAETDRLLKQLIELP